MKTFLMMMFRLQRFRSTKSFSSSGSENHHHHHQIPNNHRHSLTPHPPPMEVLEAEVMRVFEDFYENGHFGFGVFERSRNQRV